MPFEPAGLTPLLGVFDMPRALAFYRDILGFEVVASSPEVDTPEGHFSHWMWLRLGGVDVMLNTIYDSGERPVHESRERADAHSDTSLYIACRDIEETYTHLTDRGLKADPPVRAPYGLKLFSTKDPDGYTIVFQEIGKSEDK
jgi:uncharacterized glyoxalase superfamily protein PhnB